MTIKYIVEYGDRSCSHVLHIFSNKEDAEAYLKPYYDLKAKYGKDVDDYDFVPGFHPSIREIEIDGNPRELKFMRRIWFEKYGEIFDNDIKLMNETELEITKYWYETFTIDEEESVKEFEAYFKNLKTTQRRKQK